MMRVLEETGGLARWLASLFLMALIVGATFLAVTAFFPGVTYIDRLGAAYEVLWQNTTQEQFTDIMRRKPWLYVIPGGGVILVSGWQLPRKFYGRAILTHIVFGIGFVGGHVFW